MKELVKEINSNWATKHLKGDDLDLLKQAGRHLNSKNIELALLDKIVNYFLSQN